MTYLTTPEQLQALFETPVDAALLKQATRLEPIYQSWIARSPFAVLTTRGPDGLDTSPRGDPAPLVAMPDPHTLLLPDRRGNNRIDSLKNILHDDRVALIFFIPGVRETIRVTGRAKICVAAEMLARFTMQGQVPKCVIEVKVEKVLFQCARALLRSDFWHAGQLAAKPEVPSAGQILSAMTQNRFDGASYDAELPARQARTLY